MIKRILKENYIYILIDILLIIIFYLIKNSFLYEKVLTLDTKILAIRDNVIDERFTLFFKNLTFLGEYYIPVIIIVCIFVFIKNKQYFYINAYNYASSVLLAGIAKIIVNRERPTLNLIPIPDKYSFPSGHTLTAIVFYIFLCYLATINKKSRYYLLPIVILIILFISMSRIYLGVHYYSDVMGAMLLAVPLLLMNINILNKHVKEKLK
jgi:undecaprenyl-diphosphatase